MYPALSGETHSEGQLVGRGDNGCTVGSITMYVAVYTYIHMCT